jgi:hypothetical protein
MPRPGLPRTRGGRLLGLIPLVVVLGAAGAFVYVAKAPTSPFSPTFTPLSVDQAVVDYRADTKAVHDDITLPSTPPKKATSSVQGFTPPAAGVYSYTTDGGDWVEYNGQRFNRTFPAVTAGIVKRSSGCVWELYLTSGKEYTDAHRQCSQPGAFLCLAHISKITFGSVSKEMIHTCDPAMLQVGGAATAAGGREKTVCHSQGHGDESEIQIRFIGNETVSVGGQAVPAYHVTLDSTVEGEIHGTAVADVWFDRRTGAYLKMIRTQDTYTDLPGGGQAYYGVRVTYQLQSLTPRT